jgi:hypothetical protein
MILYAFILFNGNYSESYESLVHVSVEWQLTKYRSRSSVARVIIYFILLSRVKFGSKRRIVEVKLQLLSI